MYFGIIADDLTGAADTGIQFAKQNFYTILLPFGLENALFHSHDVISQAETTGSIEDPHYLRETHVIAISTNSRGMQAEQAYDTVRNATEHLKGLHSQIIYKKIDSTLRGNLGIEIEAVLDITGNDLAILAPTFPAYNRTTIGGALTSNILDTFVNPDVRK
jgi:D-threonate/D-erythronate kinase